jgi:hypothetical protein
VSPERTPNRSGASFSVADPSLTIDKFCKAELISRSMLYRAWAEGWGPKFYRVGVTRRITHRARIEWQREREAAATDQTDALGAPTRGPT